MGREARKNRNLWMGVTVFLCPLLFLNGCYAIFVHIKPDSKFCFFCLFLCQMLWSCCWASPAWSSTSRSAASQTDSLTKGKTRRDHKFVKKYLYLARECERLDQEWITWRKNCLELSVISLQQSVFMYTSFLQWSESHFLTGFIH